MSPWKCINIKTGLEVEGELVAYWEAALDPISDDYTPKEISAIELFHIWEKRVIKAYPNGLIPIYWFVDYKGKSVGTFEGLPHQFEHFSRQNRDNFLTFFTWPEDTKSGERVNWLTIPVKDKLWNSAQWDKGGFIQEATGWKPAVFQPYVFLPSLINNIHG